MLLAEELLLLMLDEEKGTGAHLVWVADNGLAGALLLDLALDERGGALVVTGERPGEPALAAAWDLIAGDMRPVKHWVDTLPGKLKPIRGLVASTLVASGVLDEQRRKTLGIFPSTRFPELDPGPERELRARLRAVLVDGVEPDARTAALLGLMVPLDIVNRVVERDERKAAGLQAKAIVKSGPAGDAVQRQITAAVASAAATAVAGTTVAFAS